MALRNIRKGNDEILRKVSKKVDVIDDKIIMLLEDMEETLHKEQGAGLAAPQVGILKRVIIIDVGEGVLKLINPEIKSQSGSCIEAEGCLSIPGVVGEVIRPQKVVVDALDIEGEKITIEGEDLLARALCHEIDHLNGVLFTDKVIRYIDKD